MHRRSFLLATTAVASAGFAGCTGLLDDDPLVFESAPATIPASVLSEAGYEQTSAEELRVEHPVEVAGQRETLIVTAWQIQHEKHLDVPLGGSPEIASFTILTSPQIAVLGREFNPIANLSTEDLANQLQDQYDEIQHVELDQETPITVLGTESERARFTANTQLGGARIELYLHLLNPVDNENDHILAAGVHPRRLPDEESNVIAMMEAIDHPA